MIARVWHGFTKPEHADAYEAMLKPELLPGLSKVKGFKGSYLLRRNVGSEVEFITIILWESLESFARWLEQDYETAVIPEERRKYLSRFDSKASHYEVDVDSGFAGVLSVLSDPNLPQKVAGGLAQRGDCALRQAVGI